MATLQTSGGNKQWRIEFKNLRSLQRNFRALSDTIDGRTNGGFYQKQSEYLKFQFGIIAASLRNRIRAKSSGLGVPSRVQRAVFSFADFDAARSSAGKRSALVGVRTGAPPRHDKAIFRQWQGKQQGRKLGISLARIFESGTKRGITPKRYFESSIEAYKSSVLQAVAEAYKQAIQAFRQDARLD